MNSIEFTRLAKSDGPLTKRISLSDAGKIISDGSACVMSRGTARRERLDDLRTFANLLAALQPHEAVTLGALAGDLPDIVDVTTKRVLSKLNGTVPANLIVRTADFIRYSPGRPAFALIDFDQKGMPPEVAALIRVLGGPRAALQSIVPELQHAASVIRSSTSSGLYRTDTGQRFEGSGGFHWFLEISDGADAERFVRVLHNRCWLAGFGWMMIGTGGQLLERSIVDRTVGGGERLVFEGPPVLTVPLAQDQAARRPTLHPGATLDTAASCPPLTILENARLRELRAREAQRIAPDAAKARERFVAAQSARLAERVGISPALAAKVIARQCDGVLLPDVVLPFDDEELRGATVADVLADPAKYEGATLADPLEGIDYGHCKARIMRWADGTPWINSFAHGRTVYELRHDARSIAAALRAAPKDEASDLFVRLALAGDLDADDTV